MTEVNYSGLCSRVNLIVSICKRP